MAILLYLLPSLACLQLALFYPTDDEDPILKNYGLQFDMSKRHISTPLTESLLRTLLLRKAPREVQSNQRKKIDTTFIRFGRSYGLEKEYDDNQRITKDYNYLGSDEQQKRPSRSTHVPPSYEMSSMKPMEDSQTIPLSKPQFRIRKNSVWTECKFSEPDDVIRALMGNPCLRNYQKVKRENVNDTFIRFGKREALKWNGRKAKRSGKDHYFR